MMRVRLLTLLILLPSGAFGYTRAQTPPPTRDRKSPADPQDIALRAALEHPVRDATPLNAEIHQPNRPVAVEGRALRRFRQPPIDDDPHLSWPALTELWLISDDHALVCLLYPTPTDDKQPPLGTRIRFLGTLVRLVDYTVKSDDIPRIAPLIAGPIPPLPLSNTTPKTNASPNPTGPQWLIAAALAALAGLALAWFQLRQGDAKILDEARR